MEFKKRKIKFKAWDVENRLVMRLNSIDCNKGELFKKDHILLQFTGLFDKEDEEIYEWDVLMLSFEKFVVYWNESANGWYYSPINNFPQGSPFLIQEAGRMKRFCSYYELQSTS
jgi:hypothetical protein